DRRGGRRARRGEPGGAARPLLARGRGAARPCPARRDGPREGLALAGAGAPGGGARGEVRARARRAGGARGRRGPLVARRLAGAPRRGGGPVTVIVAAALGLLATGTFVQLARSRGW